jgi:outer membrane protein W
MLKRFSFIILFALVISGTIYSHPTATVHLAVGWCFPTGDMYGTFGDSANNFKENGDSLTYYFRNGYNYGITVKKSLGKKGNFRLTGNLNFALFSQTADFFNTLGGELAVNYSMNTLSLALGGEYCLSPRRGLFNPFVGVELTANLIGGKFETTATATDTSTTITNTLNLKHSLRIGVQMGGGVDLQLHQSVGIILGLKYSFVNLIGKSSQVAVNKEYGLNDAAHFENGYNRPARNITYLLLYGGFSYYFGR